MKTFGDLTIFLSSLHDRGIWGAIQSIQEYFGLIESPDVDGGIVKQLSSEQFELVPASNGIYRIKESVLGGGGGGDMQKEVYDIDDSGIVDRATTISDGILELDYDDLSPAASAGLLIHQEEGGQLRLGNAEYPSLWVQASEGNIDVSPQNAAYRPFIRGGLTQVDGVTGSSGVVSGEAIENSIAKTNNLPASMVVELIPDALNLRLEISNDGGLSWWTATMTPAIR